MQKKSSLLVICCFISLSCVLAQFSKGAYSLDGDADLSYNVGNYQGLYLGSIKTKTTSGSIGFNPSVAKLLNEHWELNGQVGLNYGAYKFNNKKITYRQGALGVGATYFFNPKATYKFFAASSLYYGESVRKFPMNESSTFYSSSANVGLGVLKMINPQIAVVGSVNYSVLSYDEKLDNVFTGRTLNLGFGLTHFINFKNTTETPPQYLAAKRHKIADGGIGLSFREDEGKVFVYIGNYGYFLTKNIMLGASVDATIPFNKGGYSGFRTRLMTRGYLPVTQKLSFYAEAGNFIYKKGYWNPTLAIGANYFITPYVAFDAKLLWYEWTNSSIEKSSYFRGGPMVGLITFLR